MLNYSEIKEITCHKIELTNEYLLANRIRVIQRPMPYEIKGLAIICGTWYQIEINECIPREQQWKAFLHELYHVVNNDFDRDEPVEDIEDCNPY